jgi:plastocyanin
VTTTTGAASSTVTVMAENFAFSPATVTIKVGDKVQWTFREGSHTTTSGASGTADGRWNQVITPEAPATVTFGQAGQFAYFCAFHPGMTGTVIVQT